MSTEDYYTQLQNKFPSADKDILWSIAKDISNGMGSVDDVTAADVASEGPSASDLMDS